MKREITIIIPCYNEAERFDPVLFEQYYKELPSIFFVFVNDGSTDRTEELLNNLAFAKANMHIHSLTHNVGKGEAIRQGILWALKHTKASFFAYFDADFATPLTEIKSLLQPLETNTNVQFVLGSRQKSKGTSIKRNWYRHYPGRVFALIVNLFVLKNSLYDTQCGAKLLSRNYAERYTKEAFSTRWLFDLEILVRSQKQYTAEECAIYIKEVPIREWIDRGASKIGIGDIVIIPFQLLKLIIKRFKNDQTR